MLAGCNSQRTVTRIAKRAGGCVDADVPPADGVLVVRGTFTSAHVSGAVRYALAMPNRGKGVGDIAAVAYLLPGRGSSADDAIGIGIAGFLAEHLRRGGVPFAIATLDAGESYFHPRAHGEDRLALATVEFPRFLRDMIARPFREAITGHSMGGYGALLAAEREPRRYVAVAVAGPAIFPSYDDEHRSVGDAFDSAADYARYDVTAHASALRATPVQVSVGKRDPFLPGVRLFAQALPSADVRVSDGCHDDGFWRASTPAMLQFVAAHL